MIARETFATINPRMGGIDTFKLRQRRGQIPLLDDRQRRGRGFFLVEAYLTTLVEEFRNCFGDLSLTFAAELVQGAVEPLREKWPEVVLDCRMREGDVLIGRIVRPDQPAEVFVGTSMEVSRANMTPCGEIVSVIAISASRAFDVFEIRCRRAGVDLPADFDLWAEVS